MKDHKTVEEIFALENLDANAVTVTGIPERHVEAVIAIAKLFVVVDHENPDFQPDFTKYEQRKYSPVADMGSPSGVGFSYYDFVLWNTYSLVGARLVSESREKAKAIFENYPDLYKAFMVYQREIK
ncbi:hypothetical protein [Flavobacterium limnosediminis]|nr:hypothetical protein [Flavobacterium limnosediminis]